MDFATSSINSPLSPAQAIAEGDKLIKVDLAPAIKLINSQLKAKMHTGVKACNVSLEGYGYCKPEIIDGVVDAFERRGWRITTSRGSQYNQPYVNFVFEVR